VNKKNICFKSLNKKNQTGLFVALNKTKKEKLFECKEVRKGRRRRRKTKFLIHHP
jgi:hypothetical protein